MRPRLYLDEDVYHAVAISMRRRGFDVLTTHEAGHSASTDEGQLQFAVTEQRCLFTFNRGHFAQLHTLFLARGDHHFGIIVARQSSIGTVVRSLATLLSTHSDHDLRDQLIWLSMQ